MNPGRLVKPFYPVRIATGGGPNGGPPQSEKFSTPVVLGRDDVLVVWARRKTTDATTVNVILDWVEEF